MFDHLRDRRQDRHENWSLALGGGILALLFAAFPLGLSEVTSARETSVQRLVHSQGAQEAGPGSGRGDARGRTAEDPAQGVTVRFAASGREPGGATGPAKTAVGSGEVGGIDCARGRHDASLAQ